jgi:hypothetical protein
MLIRKTIDRPEGIFKSLRVKLFLEKKPGAGAVFFSSKLYSTVKWGGASLGRAKEKFKAGRTGAFFSFFGLGCLDRAQRLGGA